MSNLFLFEEDKKFISTQCELVQYDCQKELIDELEKFSNQSTVNDNELATILGEEFKEGIVNSGVVATVDFFDSSKGFGFVELDTTDSRVFIHTEKLKDYGVDTIRDGDSILCDVARGPKGLYIEKIYDIQIDTSKIESVSCQIIRLFPERKYEFVKLQDSDRTAFFHVSVFPADARSTIHEGQFLKAEVSPDKKGDGLKVGQILSISS